MNGPDLGIQDQNINVNWTVANLGAGVAGGPWFDAIYLSNDAIWSPDDLFLGELKHEADLGPGQSYAAATSVKLPGVLPGSRHLLVRANARIDVFEGLALANNTRAAATPMLMDLPALVLSAPTNGQLTATGASKLYKVAVPDGGDLQVTLTGPAGHVNELYVGIDELPTRQSYAERGARAGQANQSASIAGTRAGFVYILVYGAELPAAQTFTLTATLSGFAIKSVAPVRGSSSGQVTLTIDGSQFDANTSARLVDSAGGTINPWSSTGARKSLVT